MELRSREIWLMISGRMSRLASTWILEVIAYSFSTMLAGAHELDFLGFKTTLPPAAIISMF